MSDKEQPSIMRLGIRLTPDEAALMDEAQELLQEYIARNAKKYGAAFRVTQRIVVIQAVTELRDRLKELLRKR